MDSIALEILLPESEPGSRREDYTNGIGMFLQMKA
jgi:hypothetical protein